MADREALTRGSKYEAVAHVLEECGDAWQAAMILEAYRRGLRDVAIAKAAAVGMPYAEIAGRARVTKGRVAQVVAMLRGSRDG